MLVATSALAASARAATAFGLGAGSYPDVAVGPDGTAHVVWNGLDATHTLHYCRVPRSASACPDPKTLPLPGDGGAGRIFFQAPSTVVAWSSRCCFGATNDEASYALVSTDGGTSFGPARQIGDLEKGKATFGPGQAISVAGHDTYQRQPLSGPPATGYVSFASTAGFLDYAVGVFNDAIPLVVRTNASGTSFDRYEGPGSQHESGWVGPMPVEPRGEEVRLAGGPAGLVLIYQQGPPGQRQYVARKFTGTTFAAPVTVTEPGGLTRSSDLFAQPATGAFHAVWDNLQVGLRWAVSADGITWSKPATLLVSTDTAGLWQPEIAAAPDGQGLVVWHVVGAAPDAVRAARLEPLKDPDKTTPLADKTAPTIQRFSMTKRRFRASRRPQTAFNFSLSEKAAMAIAIERPRPGRRARPRAGRCLPATAKLRRNRPCTRYQRQGTIRSNGQPGANSVPFGGRIGSRTLRPGRYRASLRATDAAGNASQRQAITFTIVRG